MNKRLEINKLMSSFYTKMGVCFEETKETEFIFIEDILIITNVATNKKGETNERKRQKKN